MNMRQRSISTDEILKHNRSDDCWIVVENKVWDVTDFAQTHPGGSAVILKCAGKDATEEYLSVHSPALIGGYLSRDCLKGDLDENTVTETWKAVNSPVEKSTAMQPPDEKPPLEAILNSYDFEDAAAKFAKQKAFAFYSTADTDCWTREANQKMIKRIWFRPRVMRDVSVVDTSSTIMGNPVDFPLFICPMGLAKLIHPEAEKGLARGAKASGIIQIVSSSAAFPLEEIMQAAPGHPFFFQLYVNKDRELSRKALLTAEKLGVKAIFLTVDAAGRGKRESDERLKFDSAELITNPVTGERAQVDRVGSGLTRLMGRYIDQGITWEVIDWIRSVTRLPLVLKGVTCAEDVKLAMQHGVDGILLSNHGGRNLDFTPPSILLLLEMHKNCPEVFDRMEVYVDGGFRRGSDILKALCLGAKAVGVGRTFLYSLNYGTDGVNHLVQCLRDEMESAMKLIGVKNLSELHPGLVNTNNVDHLVPSSAGHPYARRHGPAKL
ncbi:FMN-dependent dehydrogenase-domain-containing protein [Aspergillus keveii]|uniref:FMN-dependent dehydrogenase-domain-containing protein n=1 Tax=Aspergillus keveii TaxID=714993 RepID=A0ABR4GQC1_9EURO